MRTKFDINLLNSFVNENSIELIGTYEKLTRETLINGKCKTANCEDKFNKAFRTLFINNSFFCDLCVMKNKCQKIKETNLKTCGFTSNLKCLKTKEKIKQTNLIKYGVENVFESKKIKSKIKSTLLEKYQVEYPTQNKQIREKIQDTFLKKYGVEHPFQNAEYAEKQLKNCYKNKEYIYPSGKIIKVQGYENYALDFLLNNENINENDIITTRKLVPEIWYNDENNKKHRHYVDIFIPSLNKCLEVKSTWTAEKKKDCIFLKQNAAKELGYNYEIWVYDGKGNIVNKYC
jgi:hypothetical protein